jgi:DNA-binding NarL/FixJ family response regulator
VSHQNVKTAIATSRRGLEEIRQVIHELSTDVESSALTEAPELHRRLRELEDRSHGPAKVSTRIDGVSMPLSNRLAAALVASARGALANAQEHSGADHVMMTLTYTGEEIRLDIRDDGRGFDVDTVSSRREAAASGDVRTRRATTDTSSPTRGLGLKGIRDRVIELGGGAEIESEPGDGTTVSVWFPIGSSAQTDIRVLLVDDHPVVRAGLAALINGLDNMSVVAEADDLESTLRAVAIHQPNVILMDLNLGAAEYSGVHIIAELNRRADGNPTPRILVLTTYQTESDILRALDAGALGYLLKDAPADDLLAAIRATARGETALSPAIASTLVRRSSRPGPTITEREVEVLELLARGMGNKDLAKTMFISEGTVKAHLAHIYGKLGVDTRAGAVAAAIERRIIRVD